VYSEVISMIEKYAITGNILKIMQFAVGWMALFAADCLINLLCSNTLTFSVYGVHEIRLLYPRMSWYTTVGRAFSCASSQNKILSSRPHEIHQFNITNVVFNLWKSFMADVFEIFKHIRYWKDVLSENFALSPCIALWLKLLANWIENYLPWTTTVTYWITIQTWLYFSHFWIVHIFREKGNKQINSSAQNELKIMFTLKLNKPCSELGASD
jgi:hypothetical protein